MNRSNLKLAENHLYDDRQDMIAAGLTESQINAVIRIRDIYTWLRDNPSATDRELIHLLTDRHQVQKSQAYNDLKTIKILIGTFEQSTKDWYRWKFNARNEETRNCAKNWEDAKAMARCDHDFAKFNKLDQEDIEQFDWTTIAVQPFVPVSDPTMIGIKPIPNIKEKIEALEKEYARDLEAVDTDYEDITFDPEDIYKTETELENEKWR